MIFNKKFGVNTVKKFAKIKELSIIDLCDNFGVYYIKIKYGKKRKEVRLKWC